MDKCHFPPFFYLPALLLPLLMPWSWGALLILPVAAVLGCSGRRRLAWYVGLGGCLALHWGIEWASWSIPPACHRSEVSLTGEVVSLPRVVITHRGGEGQYFLIKLTGSGIEGCGKPARLAVYLDEDINVVEIGHALRLRGRLYPPPGQWSPGAIPDQARWLAWRLHGRLVVTQLTILDRPAGALPELRKRLADRLAGLGGPERSIGLLEALVLGQGRAIPSDDWERFRRLGITHAFVVSGLHLGMVFVGAWWLARRCLVACWPQGVGRRDWAVLPASMVALGYAGLAGFSLPTQRALIMILLTSVLRVGGWRTPSWRLLAVAGSLILSNDYFAILGSSFWLSIVATGVLLFTATVLNPKIGLSSSSWLGRALVTQVVILFFMMPVTLFWFGEVSLAAVITNLLIVPLVSVILIPLALMGTLWGVIGGATGNPPWAMAQFVATGALRTIEIFDQRLPDWALIRSPLPHLTGSRQPVLAVLDVGQGLAVVSHIGDQVWVYDTGDAPPQGRSQADKILTPFLRDRGVDHVAIQIVSHPDRDHAGGMEDLARAVAIERRVGFGGEPCRAGQVLYDHDDVTLTLLNGPGENNNSSCVIRWRYRDRTVLVTGDIDADRERALVRYWREKLRADVLVTAHHGSNTSTTLAFLKWVDPKVALISSARANRFGHPHPAVLERLGKRGVDILNTASHGALMFFPEDNRAEIRALRSGNIPYWLQLHELR